MICDIELFWPHHSRISNQAEINLIEKLAFIASELASIRLYVRP